MGRHSLKAERRAQILEGFAKCVAAHGLGGATLERIAEYSGLKRAALRHNIGNRDAIIDAALTHMTQELLSETSEMLEALPSDRRLEAALSYLFQGPFCAGPDDDERLIDELMALRHRNPQVERSLRRTYQLFVEGIGELLAKAYPQAEPARCQQVAYALGAMAYGNATFVSLRVQPHKGAAMVAMAKALLATLA